MFFVMVHDVLHSRTDPAVSGSPDNLEVVRIPIMVLMADYERAASVCNALQEAPVVSRIPGTEDQGVLLHLYYLEVRCVDAVEVSGGDHCGVFLVVYLVSRRRLPDYYTV